MTRKKLPESCLPDRAPNYANARGREATEDNQGIIEESNPGVSPGSLPEPVEDPRTTVSGGAGEFQDRNYAQYMNRGDGRYLKFMEGQAEGSFGSDADHDGETKAIHRLKTRNYPERWNLPEPEV